MNKQIFLIYLFIIVGISACQKSGTPTYYADIEPLLQKHCISCHRPDGAAPFSLMSQKEVYRKKKTIRKVVKDRYMPPWPADPSYSHFIGEKYLSDADIEKIVDWVDAGAPLGKPVRRDEVVYPAYSTLGTPDLTLYLDSIPVFGNAKDRFLVVKVPFLLDSDTFIRAIEFVPGNRNLVHHMNGHLLMYDWEAKKDPFDGERIADVELQSGTEYIRQFEALKLYNDDGSKPVRIHSAVNYLPGVEGVMYPDGIGGIRVKRKGALVANDIHYGPQSKTQFDHSRVNLFFTDKAPERPLFEIMLGTNGIVPVRPKLFIPADQVKTFYSSYVVPEDMSILTLNPHMHLLGKSFKAWAVKPTGDTIPLIHIPKWDFKWQYFYTFPRMVPVPAGSLIEMQAVFDNTSNNPFNPFRPPVDISERTDLGGAGMRTTDEMLQFIITCTKYRPGDENVSLERTKSK